MKKTIANVVNFPNGCETVRFTACFVSMLMRAEGMTDPNCDFFCGKQKGPCVRCGDCRDLTPLHRKHSELYNLYNAVAGFGFLQIDLSCDEHVAEAWQQVCNVMLRQFDWYIGYAFDYAGYGYEELIFADDEKEADFEKIKASIDRDIPVLALFGRLYQWVLITGYDDKGVLYGLDGSQGYWGRPKAEPAGYDEDGLFIMPDWYEKRGHAFIMGEKKTPDVSLRDALLRAVRIMESMAEKRYYQNSVDFMRDDANFDKLSDEELLRMRDRIAGWIGQPIDQRAMLGDAMSFFAAHTEDAKEAAAFSAARFLCWTSHDALWIAWRALGEYQDGDRLTWAKGLQSRVIRDMLADCFQMVCDHDGHMLEALKEGLREK